MADRISYKADTLAGQCNLAAQAITVTSGWPTTAPTSAVMQAHADGLGAKISTVNTLESQLRVQRQALKDLIDAARGDMAKVDQATDLLYGPESGTKIQFGLDPKKSGTGNDKADPPQQVVIRATTDGTQPASIWVDWDSVEGAAYELQWFSDAALTQMVGSAALTASEMEVQGLVRGSQYWFRVRAVRGSQVGPWSDQATRVANI